MLLSMVVTARRHRTGFRLLKIKKRKRKKGKREKKKRRKKEKRKTTSSPQTTSMTKRWMPMAIKVH